MKLKLKRGTIVEANSEVEAAFEANVRRSMSMAEAKSAAKTEYQAMAKSRLEALDLVARAFQCGDESLQRVIVPAMERAMRGDVQIIDLEASDGKGLTKAVRAKGLGARLLGKGFAPELVQVALRFARDFEKARPARLTASYEGMSGGGSRVDESERFLIAIDLLSKAMAAIDGDQRRALFGCVLLDVSFADLGAMIGGHVSTDRNMRQFTGKLYATKALERLDIFYCDWDFANDNSPNRRKMA